MGTIKPSREIINNGSPETTTVVVSRNPSKVKKYI